jgi:hypothetical protein
MMEELLGMGGVPGFDRYSFSEEVTSGRVSTTEEEP